MNPPDLLDIIETSLLDVVAVRLGYCTFLAMLLSQVNDDLERVRRFQAIIYSGEAYVRSIYWYRFFKVASYGIEILFVRAVGSKNRWRF